MHSLYIYRYGWEKIPVGHALQEKRGNMMDEMLFYSVSASVATDIINSRTTGWYLVTKSGANVSLHSQHSNSMLKKLAHFLSPSLLSLHV